MHENPCWTCQKACGGCSWSRSFSPVPGWRANKTKKRGQGGTKGGYIESYYIRSCPEYDPEPKRDIPEEKGGQRLKYDIDKVMLLTRAGMTEAQAGLAWQAVKYIWRSPLKGNQAQDLDKALFYLNRLREKVKE